jgi:hypothetical protein
MLPSDLPSLIEEPEKAVKALDINGSWDLILYLGENPQGFTLLPAILSKLSAPAVIAPVDNYQWLPPGLERQIQDEVVSLGVDIVFPRTFCTLTTIGVPTIDEFASLFGAPILEVSIKDGAVACVKVRRGAPCGSTHFMAGELPGTCIEEAGARAGTLVQIYPCLASRKVDRHFGDAPIHVAGHIAKRAVEKALEV